MRLFSTHKEQKTYYSSGEIETIFQTLNNKKDGPEKIFHKNGQLKAIVNFKNGKQINEKINSYDEQGNLIRSVEFKNGFLNGPFEEFYSSGNLKTVGNYKDNNIVEKKVFDENGILKYHYVKSNSEITVKSLSEFKNELKRIIKMNYFDNLEIEIGIPKWSVFTPINVKGVYKNFNFYGIINENCKWHDFESYYENPNDFYKDLEEIKFDNLNIDFINELTKNGNCIIDFPIENYDYFNLIWEDSTPDEIQNDFTQITDFTKYCEKCEFGNISEPQIISFSVLLKNSESEITYELKWERNSDNKNYIAEKMDLLEEKILALYSNLHKSDIKNRISNIKNTNIHELKNDDFLITSKIFILNSNLSKELIEQIVDIISYIENGLILDNNLGKKIDLVYILESAYNNEIFTLFIENNNPSEGLKHIEILIKLLSYFIEESSSNVYDTIANIYLLNNRLIEAEANILNCLQVETFKNNIRPEHNLTAAKIYYKKNDLINGLKYYNKAIELRASDASIKEFDNYLNTNNLSK